FCFFPRSKLVVFKDFGPLFIWSDPMAACFSRPDIPFLIGPTGQPSCPTRTDTMNLCRFRTRNPRIRIILFLINWPRRAGFSYFFLQGMTYFRPLFFRSLPALPSLYRKGIPFFMCLASELCSICPLQIKLFCGNRSTYVFSRIIFSHC